MVCPLSEKDLSYKKSDDLRHMLMTWGISCGSKASYIKLKELLLDNNKVDKSLARIKEMNRASWALLRATAPANVQMCLDNILRSHDAGRSDGHQVCEILFFCYKKCQKIINFLAKDGQ